MGWSLWWKHLLHIWRRPATHSYRRGLVPTWRPSWWSAESAKWHQHSAAKNYPTSSVDFMLSEGNLITLVALLLSQQPLSSPWPCLHQLSICPIVPTVGRLPLSHTIPILVNSSLGTRHYGDRIGALLDETEISYQCFMLYCLFILWFSSKFGPCIWTWKIRNLIGQVGIRMVRFSSYIQGWAVTKEWSLNLPDLPRGYPVRLIVILLHQFSPNSWINKLG